jgi:uncharacterized protein (DUF934 family)
MSENTKRLWRGGGFVADEWRTAKTLDEIGEGDVIVSLALLREAGETSLARKTGRLGVRLEAGEDIDETEPWLANLSLVALAFPAFTDGRAYSKAVRLRQQHCFDGEIRAVGDVLLDQLAFMRRCGFDAMEISHDVTAERLAEGRVPDVDRYYQPAVGDGQPAASYSWRRQPAAG